jgi:hypothetical protein
MPPAVPQEVLQYLSSEDGLFRADLVQQRPDVTAMLQDPTVRSELLRWLATPEARQEGMAGLTANSLAHVRTSIEAGDRARITELAEALSQHPNYLVRLRSYELLLTLSFPSKDQPRMEALLSSMLGDPHDIVRSQAVRQIARASDAGVNLQHLLRAWHQQAPERGLVGTESYELAQRALNVG